jgi:hypothetical protein
MNELIVFFDSSLKSFQKLKPAYNPECNPATIASSINHNFYAYSVDGGALKRNPDYVKP